MRLLAAADWLWSPVRRTRTLLAYGVVAAIAASIYLWGALPEGTGLALQAHRAHDMAASVQLMEDEGAPPLLKRTPEESIEGAGLTPPSYDSVLNGGDDTGVYVYVPLIALAFDIAPLDALKALLLLFAIPVLIYPLVFHRLTGSGLAAFASPLLLVGAIVEHDMYPDLYWVSAWAVVTLVPLVILAWKRRDRWGLAMLVTVMLGAAFTSTTRGGAGLGIAIAAVCVVAFAFNRWTPARRAAGAAALVAAYLAISPGAMTVLENAAESWAGDDLYEAQVEGNNSFFHIAFIGLGYQPNDFSIYYRDTIANAYAQEAEPGVVYLSSEYNSTLRDLFFDRVSDDPGFFAELVARKLAVALLAVGLSTFVFVLVAGGYAFARGPNRDLIRMVVLASVPSIILGLSPGLLAIPQPQYVLGYTASMALIEIVIWSMLLVVLGRAFAPRARAALESSSLPRALAVPAVLGAAVIVPILVGPGPFRWLAVAAIAFASVLSIASMLRLRGRLAEVAAFGRTQVGLGAAIAILVLLAAALPLRSEANVTTNQFAVWDSDLAAIDETVNSLLPPTVPPPDLAPVS